MEKIKTLGRLWNMYVVNNYITLTAIIDKDSIPVNLTVYMGRGDNIGEVSTFADINIDNREKYDLDDNQSNNILHNEQLAIMNLIAQFFGIDGFGGYAQTITPISKKFLDFLVMAIIKRQKL